MGDPATIMAGASAGSSLLGGAKGGAQQSQQNASANKLMDTESGAITDLLKNFNTNVLPTIQSLIGGGAGGGPIGTLMQKTGDAAGKLDAIGTGLENANVFPSAGTSAMNTLLSRIGTIANPGAVVADTSRQIGQAGLEGQIDAKKAGASIIGAGGNLAASGLQSGIGDIMSLLNSQISPLSSNLSQLGNLGQTKLAQAGGMGSPWGDAITGATGALGNLPGKAGGSAGGGGFGDLSLGGLGLGTG